MDNSDNSKNYKFNTVFTRKRKKGLEGAFEKIQKLESNDEFNIVPLSELDTANSIAYSLKIKDYEIALSVEKYKNGEKIPKEDIRFQGTDYLRDYELITKILKELE